MFYIIVSFRCTVVLFNPRKGRQQHLLNSSRKTITSLAFSPDGRYLATGECGHLPSVRVWDLQEGGQLAEFSGHKYGINCVVSHRNRITQGITELILVRPYVYITCSKGGHTKIMRRISPLTIKY